MSTFCLFLSNTLICKDKNYGTKAYKEISDSVMNISDPVYDYIMLNLYEYYKNYYKYPQNMDTFINYLYYTSLNSVSMYYGRDIETVKNEFEALKQKILSTEERKGLLVSQIAFNYCYVNKESTQFIYEEDVIVLICGADSAYCTYKKPDVCIDRYARNTSFNFISLTERIRFYDSTGQIIPIEFDVIDALYKSINNMINSKYRKLWLSADNKPLNNNRQIITAILKYNKNGLHSFCPNDNIDLEQDQFFVDIKDILYNFMNINTNIYEIIIPIKCCESERLCI